MRTREQSNALVAKLFHAGKSDDEIAEAAGLSRKSVQIYINDMRLRAPRAGMKHGPERDAIIIRMRQEGATSAAIAAHLGCRPKTIQGRITDLGLMGVRNIVLTPERIRRIQAFRASGMTITRICEVTGLGKTAVARAINYQFDDAPKVPMKRWVCSNCQRDCEIERTNF
ncbi:MAG TPA: hypothetical protein PLI96_11400, partial [Halothiobacillus sp.]|nr:hypothetical protein [Halothiobacillus sp.]